MDASRIRWVPLDYPSIKVNVDAAVRGSFTVASEVLRDCNGDVKGVVAVKIESMEPVQTEALVAMHHI